MKLFTFRPTTFVLLAALSTAQAAGSGGPAQDFPRWRGTPELTVYAPAAPQAGRAELRQPPQRLHPSGDATPLIPRQRC
jgi:hypothetical protein